MILYIRGESSIYPARIERCYLKQFFGMPKPPNRRKATGFVTRLYDMMTTMRFSPLCGFAPDGKSFYVTNTTDFLETVLPQVRALIPTEFIKALIICVYRFLLPILLSLKNTTVLVMKMKRCSRFLK